MAMDGPVVLHQINPLHRRVSCLKLLVVTPELCHAQALTLLGMELPGDGVQAATDTAFAVRTVAKASKGTRTACWCVAARDARTTVVGQLILIQQDHALRLCLRLSVRCCDVQPFQLIVRV